MDLKPPKKKRCQLELKSALPLVFDGKGKLTTFHAHLSALGTCIIDPTEMEMIYTMGFFGKGSLSKSYPSFGRSKHGAPALISNRQWQRRQEWINEVRKLSEETNFNSKIEADDMEVVSEQGSEDKTTEESSSVKTEVVCEKTLDELELLDNNSIQKGKEIDEIVLDSTEEEDFEENDNSFEGIDILNIASAANEEFKSDVDLQSQLLVLPDSESDTENYLKNIKSEVKTGNFPVRETLHLTFEETFFLMYGLGCLRLVDFDGKILNIENSWNMFCKEQKHFLEKYVVYHYFRSLGWVVKPGLKYGGDFLLYKDGPPFYHSSYIVIIDVLDGITMKRIEKKNLA